MAKRRGLRVAHLLKRKGWRPPQTNIPPSQRERNVRGSFVIAPVDLKNWHIWLVDDVKTSGATLRVCARLLRKAGAARVSAAVCCKKVLPYVCIVRFGIATPRGLPLAQNH